MFFRRLSFKYILTMFDATQKLYSALFLIVLNDEKHLESWTKLKLPLSSIFLVLLNYMKYTTSFLSNWAFLFKIKSFCVDTPVCYVIMLCFECLKEFFIRELSCFYCFANANLLNVWSRHVLVYHSLKITTCYRCRGSNVWSATDMSPQIVMFLSLVPL